MSIVLVRERDFSLVHANGREGLGDPEKREGRSLDGMGEGERRPEGETLR